MYREDYRSSAIASEGERTTIAYNKQQLSRFDQFSGARSLRLIRPLVSVVYVAEQASRAKVLSIGPRTEAELFALLPYGFKRRNVSGVDLISYSSWIDLGDIHDLPYPDSSFDVILCGWVLPYTNEKKKACDEIVRVARDGAVVAVGATYDPDSKFTAAPIDSTSDILALFSSAVERVFFSYDARQEQYKPSDSVIAVFRLRKGDRRGELPAATFTRTER